MTPRCVGALLARNEAAPDRYLQRVLDNIAQFVDAIVVVDDHSTDATVDICHGQSKVVAVHDLGSAHPTGSPPAGGWWAESGEVNSRSFLWDWAGAVAGADGWILVFDADMELLGISPTEFRRLLQATAVNAWCWPLYDCWDADTQMRVDGYWQAHLMPRPWLARAQPIDNYVPQWHLRGIHSGHLPANYPLIPGNAPEGVAWRHLGYVNLDHRRRKARQYLNLPQLV